MKTFTHLNLNQTFVFDTSFPKEFPVSFQTHSQSKLLNLQNKKQKDKLFKQVFDFVYFLIEDQKFYQNIKQFLTRNQTLKQKTQTKMADDPEDSGEPLKNLSFKKVQTTSRNNCFSSFNNTKMPQINISNERRCGKKISIVIFSNQDQEQMFSGSDSIISEEQLKTLRQIKLPNLKLSEQLIKEIYQAPSPFLMNSSLCLFLKYCICRNAKPQWGDAAWILAISTILAFKLFYDEELQGMFECFQSTLKISREDLVDLERCFLEKIDYDLIIKNYDYQYVLSKFVETQKLDLKENKKG